jgi:hypothetical protein
MVALFAFFILQCPLLVALLAIAALWPRHRFWLLTLSILPWVGSKFMTTTWHSSSLVLMPSALAIMLPLLAVVIDRWKSLRIRPLFWIGMVIVAGVIGFIVANGAVGGLNLNHGGEYCSDPDSSRVDCPLDPLKVINIYLAMFGYAVTVIGVIPSLILSGWIGYRRWFGTAKLQCRRCV